MFALALPLTSHLCVLQQKRPRIQYTHRRNRDNIRPSQSQQQSATKDSDTLSVSQENPLNRHQQPWPIASLHSTSLTLVCHI